MASHDQETKQSNHVPSKDWMDSPRFEDKYREGVKSFLDFAFSIGQPQGKEIQCPCAKCCNNYWLRRNDVYQHLIVHGFVKGYRKWINHGEPIISVDVDSGMNQGGNYDDIAGLLRDAFRDIPQVEEGNKGPNEEAKIFYKLVDEASQELYPTRKDKKGETKDPQTQKMIDHLQNLKDSGHSDDEAFQSLFGKERPGRVRCYGRTVTKTSLRKEKEIKQIEQEHKREVAQLQDEVHHVNHKMDGLTNLVKVLLQQVNPGLSTEQVQAMIEVAQQSPPDASSAPNEARRNMPPSSGSSHVPTNLEDI